MNILLDGVICQTSKKSPSSYCIVLGIWQQFLAVVCRPPPWVGTRCCRRIRRSRRRGLIVPDREDTHRRAVRASPHTPPRTHSGDLNIIHRILMEEKHILYYISLSSKWCHWQHGKLGGYSWTSSSTKWAI